VVKHVSGKIRRVVRGAAVLMLARVAMMVMGMLQTILIARWFGASIMVDAFFIAMAVPILFLGVVETNLSLAFTPLFIELEESDKPADAWILAATLLKCGAMLVGGYALVTLVLAGPLAAMLAPGFEPEARLELVRMIRILSPLGLCMFVSATLAALCFVRGKFLLPGITYLVNAGAPLLALALFYRYIGIDSLVFGLLAGAVIGVGLLFPCFGIRHPVFRTPCNLRHRSVLAFGKMMALRTAATSLVQINIAVDGAFASTVAPGHVANLAYASRLLLAMKRLVVFPLGRSLMPALSRAVAKGDHETLQRIINGATRLLGLCIIPLFGFVIIFREEVVVILFGSGAFSDDAVRLTSQALMFYALGALSTVLNPVLTATHFALRDSISPLKFALAGVVLNVVMNVVCLRLFSTGGIALATSIVITATTILLWRSVGRLSGKLDLRSVVLSFMRALAGTLLLGVVASVVYRRMPLPAGTHPVLHLLVAFVFGGMAYVLLQMALGWKELIRLRSLFKREKGAGGGGIQLAE
jgi:putative peptidoglycan lipid II flippase